MNKKGDFSILILVILCFVLVGATLFSFLINSNGTKTRVSDISFVEGAYAKEGMIRMQLQDKMESVLLEGYSSSLTGSIIDLEKAQKNYESKVVGVKQMNLMINGAEIKSIGFETRTKDDLLTSRIINEIPISLNNGQADNVIALVYKPKIEEILNVSKLGLNTFSQINSVKVLCKNDDKVIMVSCMQEKLSNFDVKLIEPAGKPGYISLMSKKKFYYSGNVDKISFSIGL